MSQYTCNFSYLCFICKRNIHVLFISLSISLSTFSHGLSRSGTEYGPLTDLPDWSYAGKLTAYC